MSKFTDQDALDKWHAPGDDEETGLSDSNALLCAIEAMDEEIREKSIKLLRMRNEWLKLKGWEITSEEIGPTHSYFYQKSGELFICEHEAIDRELHGA